MNAWHKLEIMFSLRCLYRSLSDPDTGYPVFVFDPDIMCEGVAVPTTLFNLLLQFLDIDARHHPVHVEQLNDRLETIKGVAIAVRNPPGWVRNLS